MALSRQTEGFMNSLTRLMKSAISIPDYSSISKRSISVPRHVLSQALEPGSLVIVDSTGLKVYGKDEWHQEKHDVPARRTCRKLHLAIDKHHPILACELTTPEVGDPSAVADLLTQIVAPFDIFMGDGAYDGEPVSQAVLNHQPPAQVVIPPHKTAVLSGAGNTHRDHHIQVIAQQGRLAWQRITGYNLRDYAELAMQRYKRIFGNTMKARALPQQKTETQRRVWGGLCSARDGHFVSTRRTCTSIGCRLCKRAGEDKMQRLLIGTEIEDWVQRVREELDLPVRLSLWTGHTFALGSFDTPAVEIRVRDAAALPLLLESSLDTLGEAYLKQHIDVEGNPADIVDVARRLSSLCGPRPAVVRRARALSSVEPNEHESVRYHYDVSNDFYKLWLDENMAYACAHFDRADESLETAQLNAIDRILVKIRLRPGQSLLDVDCGWGALAIRAAQRYDARCVGLTRSERQYQLATERVRAAGLSDRVEIRLANYRTLSGRFDRITSVCLGASVGARDLAGRFAKLQSLLTDDGIVLTHTFTSMAADPGDAPAPGDPFAERYVFPTAHPPHLSFALRAMQQGGLESLDIENLRGHYARTLQCWVQRFEQNADRIRQAVGETKFRIWRVYLVGRVYTFSVGRASIYQIAGQKAGRPAASLRRPDTSLQRPVLELPAATEPRPSRAPEPAHSNCAPADDAPLYARRPLRQVYPVVDILPDADRNLDAGPRRRLAGGGSS